MPSTIQDPTTVALIEAINAVYFAKTKTLADYPADYQAKIKQGYRFSGHIRIADEPTKFPPLSRETLELV